jgi:hypothetical protein
VDRDTGICWVRDLLPQELADLAVLRVLSFGFDNDIDPAADIVADFLSRLIDIRRETQVCSALCLQGIS